MEEQKENHGETLRSLRSLAGLTLKEVAAGADISIAYLSKVENGAKVPTPGYMGAVAGFIAGELARRHS